MKKIIIIEDSKEMCFVYEHLIRKHFPDTEFEIYSTGEEGLRRLMQNHFDVLLVDVNLPDKDIDGNKLARCAYALGKHVLIVTSNTLYDKLKFYTLNPDMIPMVAYMLKPFNTEKFIETLKKLLEKKSIPLDTMFYKLIDK